VKIWLKRYSIKLLFLVAASALVATGAWLANVQFDEKLLFTIYLANLGTWFLYGFDFRKPFKAGWQRLFIAQLLVAFGFSVCYLSGIQFLVLGFIFLLGLLYQAEIPLIGNGFQIKKLLVFKNVLIGISWASLIPFGANDLYQPTTQFMFWFVAVQVGFGSIIRDINDVAHDRNKGLTTLPIYLGIPKTLLVLNMVNLLSIFICVPFVGFDPTSWLFLFSICVIIYKAFMLIRVQQNHDQQIWTQYLNILTCLLIFLLTCFFY
jgi:4-hydroxybenzoate polyprenyltransferase